MEQYVQDLVLSVLHDLLYAAGVSLFAYLVAIARSKLGADKMKKAEALAAEAVKYVQQKYPNIANREKFQKAADYLSAELSKIGFKADSGKIEGMIESTLGDLKNVFVQDWQSATADSAPTSHTVNVNVTAPASDTTATKGPGDYPVAVDVVTQAPAQDASGNVGP